MLFSHQTRQIFIISFHITLKYIWFHTAHYFIWVSPSTTARTIMDSSKSKGLKGPSTKYNSKWKLTGKKSRLLPGICPSLSPLPCLMIFRATSSLSWIYRTLKMEKNRNSWGSKGQRISKQQPNWEANTTPLIIWIRTLTFRKRPKKLMESKTNLIIFIRLLGPRMKES